MRHEVSSNLMLFYGTIASHRITTDEGVVIVIVFGGVLYPT